MGYKELLIQSMGGLCEFCQTTENLNIAEVEDKPKVVCSKCAEEKGITINDSICDAHVTQNNQVTIGSKIREVLGIEPGDNVYFKILKVISPEGEIKYGGS